jgi:Peptidase A4 family
MPITKFPSGLQVETFEPPPRGFDPLKASNAELVKHGIPRRPIEDQRTMKEYEAVLRRLQRRFFYIEPTFTRREDKQHRPRMRIAEATESSTNWSGAVQFASSGNAFKWVQGTWTVPNVYAPVQNPLGWSYCSSWIGIDGDGSNDVCQAGVEHEIFGPEGLSVRICYPWWEWFPENEIQIPNFPVYAGDQVTCLICTTGAGATKASIFFTNLSSGMSTSFLITAPSGTQLAGNSAEWIVERPSVNGALTSLADYGGMFFFNADAFDGSLIKSAGQGNDMDMTDGSGKTISDGILSAPKVIQCVYMG